MSARTAKAEAQRRLEQFRLADRARQPIAALSGGMAQRLMVARAIMHRPATIFLDEPTAGLDPQSRLALWEVVRGLKAEGVTVLLTTHYMEEADRLSDRLAIMDHGRILVQGTPADLKRRVGAESVIELVLERPDPGLVDIAAALPGVRTVQPTATGFRVFAASRDGLLPRLVELVVPAGLRDVAVHEPTLETVFIQLTGRELRD